MNKSPRPGSLNPLVIGALEGTLSADELRRLRCLNPLVIGALEGTLLRPMSQVRRT